MTVLAPSTAERIRSACARGGGAMLAVEGIEPAATPVHHLLGDGSFAITVPANGLLSGMVVAAGATEVQAVLEMTDYAPCRCANRCDHWSGFAATCTTSRTATCPTFST